MIAASPWGRHDRSPLRAAVASAGIVALYSLARVTIELQNADVVRGALPLLWLARTPLGISCAAAGGALLLVAFAAGKRTILAGLAAFAVLAWMQGAATALGAETDERFHTTAAVILAWCVGLALADLALVDRHQPCRDEVAEAAGASALIAPYIISGVLKYHFGGIDWARGDSLRAFLMAHSGFEPGGVRALAVDWIVASPSVASTLMTVVLASQLLAVLFLVNRRLRMVIGIALFAFHAGLGLLARFPFPENMILLLSFALPWPTLLRRRLPEAASTTEAPTAHPGATLRLLLLSTAVVGTASWWARDPSTPAIDRTRPPPAAATQGTRTEVETQVGPWTMRRTRIEGQGHECIEVSEGEDRIWMLIPALPDMPMEDCGPKSLAPIEGDLQGKPFRYRASEASAARLAEALTLVPTDPDPVEGEAPSSP